MRVVLGLLAVGTYSPQSQAVMCRFEPKVACHLVLKLFYGSRKELYDATALGADHMIVVLVIVMMFVIGLVITKADLASKAGLGQKTQGAIYGRQPDRGVSLVDKAVQVLACKVLLGA